MVEILERLAVGFEIVIDKNIWFRRQASLRHQVKFEPQVSERAKGFEKHEPPFALKVASDEKDLDGIGVRHAWRWSSPIIHIHARRNDGNLIGWHFIIA